MVLSAETKMLVARGVRSILEAVGDEVDMQGTADTPRRVAQMYDELLSGYTIDPRQLLNGALFDVEYDEMVVVADIDFYSLCEQSPSAVLRKGARGVPCPTRRLWACRRSRGS